MFTCLPELQFHYLIFFFSLSSYKYTCNDPLTFINIVIQNWLTCFTLSGYEVRCISVVTSSEKNSFFVKPALSEAQFCAKSGQNK